MFQLLIPFLLTLSHEYLRSKHPESLFKDKYHRNNPNFIFSPNRPTQFSHIQHPTQVTSYSCLIFSPLFNMKIPTLTILLPILLTTTTNAWELTIWLANGKHVTTHGTIDSGCVTYNFNMNSPVNRAVFSKSFWAKTFELYEHKNCRGKASYREGQGEHSVVPPRIIKSYKVY
ncbi:hypothetical protein COCSADRAFT_331252 [Bipolaris sorokiniana ND90Pr]|uniref:Uncharacterized protein n=1 Tax=Cochliobolus sativus (strain ND90Pr / ATCC 201652) TaxID=665912 RepID=M2RA46_COCSN|nr:uncharacterized protein COCSADRAFT_331252 [Bipolaris sorokiniana ND90Pr]EMD63749.1 hypothetical protein COCSADRAFT_331252 [Bipolaris sorokiniana ND90Pr]